MVAAVIGRTKTAAYVGGVALFSVCAGLIFGAWVDGAGGSLLAGVMGVFLAGLVVALAWLRRRQRLVVAT
jgi:membrane protease YdiL (CAAX protease family)